MSLIGSGSAGKYGLYALGEIALVVIGILIALQINTWKEQQESNRIEQQLLLGIQEEMMINRSQIQEVIEAYEHAANCNKELLNYFHKPPQPDDHEKIDSLVGWIVSFWTYNLCLFFDVFTFAFFFYPGFYFIKEFFYIKWTTISKL